MSVAAAAAIWSAIALFMTLSGLALFYAGLVQRRNALSVLMQCFAIACVMSILWVVGGYSLAFGESSLGGLIGGFSVAWLSGVSFDTPSRVLPNIPESVFVMFQMTFAIITPTLVIGVAAGGGCFVATQFMQRVLKIDDSLDVFPVHGVGGPSHSGSGQSVICRAGR